MKFLIAALLMTGSFAHANELQLVGSCKDKAVKAAEKAAPEDSFFTQDVSQNEDDQSVFDFGFSDNENDGDGCFYNVQVKVKATKKDANKIYECTIESAEDDGQPNCG
jgi:hypothetical protein